MTELISAAGKRCKVMVMTGQALFSFMRGLDGRAAYRLYGMPADCHVLGISISDKAPGSVAFLLGSTEWDVVPEDAPEIPEVKFDILTAVLPPGSRVEKPPPKFRPLPAAGGPRG